MFSDGVRQEFANIFRYPMARILSMARIMSTAGIRDNHLVENTEKYPPPQSCLHVPYPTHRTGGGTAVTKSNGLIM